VLVVSDVNATNIARLWDPATGQAIGQPLTHHGFIYPPVFSPDSRIILTPSVDGTARFWDAATGRPDGLPLKLKPPGGFRSAAFSPDGKTILTGSLDGTAQFWDMVTRQPIDPPMRHESEVLGVVFSPDGKTVITTCLDNDSGISNFGMRRRASPSHAFRNPAGTRSSRSAPMARSS
jgi:WD40 repeat protein